MKKDLIEKMEVYLDPFQNQLNKRIKTDRLENFLELNKQSVDLGKRIDIGEYKCILYFDSDERHWRVEVDKIGNVGRSKLNAEDAIRDAEATLTSVRETAQGVFFGQGPDIRRYPKTGWSRDFMLSRERNLTPRNMSGFANTIFTYDDPLDPVRNKTPRKPTWGIIHKRVIG